MELILEVAAGVVLGGLILTNLELSLGLLMCGVLIAAVLGVIFGLYLWYEVDPRSFSAIGHMALLGIALAYVTQTVASRNNLSRNSPPLPPSGKFYKWRHIGFLATATLSVLAFKFSTPAVSMATIVFLFPLSLYLYENLKSHKPFDYIKNWRTNVLGQKDKSSG